MDIKIFVRVLLTKRWNTPTGALTNPKNFDLTTNIESLGVKPLYAEPSNDTSSLCDPSVTLVYMTALLENCPYGSVEDTVLNSIFEILSGKEQAKENINKISVGNIFNQQSRNFKFNHRVWIMLHVKTSNLQEMAKRYIWRNFGTSKWYLQDGTRLSFTKIHQKWKFYPTILYVVQLILRLKYSLIIISIMTALTNYDDILD